MTDTKRVYVVIDYCPVTGEPVFKGVFFSKETAQAFINAQDSWRRDYRIEIYKESEEGTAVEIYED